MNSSQSQRFKFLLFFLIFFHTISISAINFSHKEKEWIKENPTVTLGGDYSWPPYDFVDNHSNHTGISADFLALISKKSGLKFNVKTGIWSKIMQKMQAGKLDGLACAASTPKREKYLNFTTTYVEMPLAIITLNKRHDINSITDLKDKSVAVNRGSYLHEWLEKNHPNINLHLTSSNIDSLQAVSFSHVDAYIGNIAIATYIMKKKYHIVKLCAL